jgi:xanthine dehydrogenase YagS FAD-binding subunit
MIDFEYVDVENMKELPELLDQEEGRSVVLAGGTDLLDRLKERLEQPARVVNVKKIEGMQGIEYADGLDIGALTTIAELADDERIQRDYPALAQAAASIATPQLRNMGTLGGNLCQRPRCWYFRDQDYPCRKKGGSRCFARTGLNKNHAIFGDGPCYIVHPSDSAPALQALGAELEIVGPKGKRETPVEGFFQMPDENILGENILGANEVIVRVRVPKPAMGTRSTYLKFRAKQSLDFAVSSVAAVLQMDRGQVQAARLVLGGVAPIPWRCAAAEAELEGTGLADAAIGRAADAVVADAQPMSDNKYKVRLTRNLVRQALESLREG